jgi:hypothetical protein
VPFPAIPLKKGKKLITKPSASGGKARNYIICLFFVFSPAPLNLFFCLTGVLSWFRDNKFFFGSGLSGLAFLKSVHHIPYPCTEMFYFSGDLFRCAFFANMGDLHAVPAQPCFLKKIAHGLRSLVRPQVSFKVSAFTLGARYQNRTVGTGFKSLEQVNEFHLTRTGQTYAL